MLDLVIRGANLPDGRQDIDIGIEGGKIVKVGSALDASAGKEIDAKGRLVTPPFVDAHFHMDATLSLGLPRLNQSGTLLEGIALWGELKPLLTEEAIAERALRYCDWAVAKGLLAIRSHVDVCDPRLLAVRALLQVRQQVKPYLDLQLVAFPQDGVLRAPGALDNLKRALDLGVAVVGGIPHFERTMDDGRSIELVRFFEAPQKRVFKAWTEPEDMKRWFGPNGFTLPYCTSDLRPGGVVHFCMRSPEGQDTWGKGVYREVVEPEKLVWMDTFADKDGNVVDPSVYGMPNWPKEALVSVTFKEQGSRTKLTLRHEAGSAPAAGPPGTPDPPARAPPPRSARGRAPLPPFAWRRPADASRSPRPTLAMNDARPWLFRGAR